MPKFYNAALKQSRQSLLNLCKNQTASFFIWMAECHSRTLFSVWIHWINYKILTPLQLWTPSHNDFKWLGIWLRYEKWKTDTSATNSIHSNEFQTYILMSIFLVFIAPVCLKKKLHTSFPPNQRRLCEIPKDERKKKNT